MVTPTAPFIDDLSPVYQQQQVHVNVIPQAENVAETDSKVNGYVITFFAVVASIFLLCSLAFVEVEIVFFLAILSLALLIFFAWDNDCGCDCGCDDTYSYSSYSSPAIQPEQIHVVLEEATRPRVVAHHVAPHPVVPLVATPRKRQAPPLSKRGYKKPIIVQTAARTPRHMPTTRPPGTRVTANQPRPARHATQPPRSSNRGAPQHMPIERPNRR